MVSLSALDGGICICICILYNIRLKVLGHKVATGPQLRAGERERPARLPPRYDERRHLAHTSINCVRGNDDYGDDDEVGEYDKDDED